MSVYFASEQLVTLSYGIQYALIWASVKGAAENGDMATVFCAT